MKKSGFKKKHKKKLVGSLSIAGKGEGSRKSVFLFFLQSLQKVLYNGRITTKCIFPLFFFCVSLNFTKSVIQSRLLLIAFYFIKS